MALSTCCTEKNFDTLDMVDSCPVEVTILPRLEQLHCSDPVPENGSYSYYMDNNYELDDDDDEDDEDTL